MTRLLMTSDAAGGVWTYTVDLVRELAGLGVDVDVAVTGPAPNARQRGELDVAGAAAVHGHDFGPDWTAEPWHDVDRAGPWLLDLESELAPDLVHLNGCTHGALAWRSPTVVVTHSDVLWWWAAVHKSPVPTEWRTYRDRVRRGLAGAGAVVAPSAAMARAVTRHYGFGAVEVIPNGRWPGWVRPVEKEAVVLGAGRMWDPAKNLSALASAAPGLSWPLVIAGPGEQKAEGNGPVAMPPPAGSDAVFLGQLDPPEMCEWQLRSGIYASPARYEPYGLGVLEAAMAGCALVLGRTDSQVELWDGAAVFVDPEDQAELTGAVNALCRDGVRRQELADAARAVAEARTAAQAAAWYMRLYGRLRSSVGAGR